jgi:HK97 family phage portal protein
MLLEKRTGGNTVVEARSDFGSSTPPTWEMMSGGVASGGRIVSPGQAITIPTIVGGLQLAAGTASALPYIVYRGLGDQKEPVYDCWQYILLETFPGLYTDPFQFKYDIYWALENFGNAFILKVKDAKTGIPVELIPLDPDHVAIRNEGGVKKFDVKTGAHQVFKGATVNEILHIKMLPKMGTMFTGTCGLRLIASRINAELSATEWEGRFFQNDATPPLVISLGEDAGPDEMREAYESWQVTHAGPYNAGKPAVLAGATVTKIGFNLADAQLIEAHGYNVQDFARAMNLPIVMFIPPHTKPASAEDEALIFSTFYMGPRLRRVESAFNSDPDFFAYNDMWLRSDEKAMIRANTIATATASHAYIQDGVLVPDEVRAELGYGPLDPLMSPADAAKNPGKIPQLTPVGGAPNDTLLDAALVKSVNENDEK